jgi:hypothetical protein
MRSYALRAKAAAPGLMLALAGAATTPTATTVDRTSVEILPRTVFPFWNAYETRPADGAATRLAMRSSSTIASTPDTRRSTSIVWLA